MTSHAANAIVSRESRLRRGCPGGRGAGDLRQIRALTAEIHALRTPHLLIAVDHEGGRVQRFHEGFIHLPAAAKFGDLYKKDKKLGKKMAYTGGWLMATECRAVGIDMSFAPVLDLGVGVSGVIGDRAFHHSPEVIADLAHEFMRGMHQAGMAATGKHFPGNGSIREDSHVAHPVDKRELNEIMMEDIRPFESMIHYGLEAIMPAHVVYEKVQPRLSSTASSA